MRLGIWMMATTAGALVSCGEPPPEPIGCDFFAASNCYTVIANSTHICWADVAGTFDAERRECVAPDDGPSEEPRVVFATPVPQDPDDDYVWDFEIVHDYGVCMRFQDLGEGGDEGVRIEFPSIGTFREKIVGEDLVLTCHGGEQYQIPLSTALTCDLSTLPGYAITSLAGSITFSWLGTGHPTPLWACGPPG